MKIWDSDSMKAALQKLGETVFFLLDTVVVSMFCCGTAFVQPEYGGMPLWGFLLLLAGYILVHLFPGIPKPGVHGKRLCICYRGVICLKVFLATSAISILFHIWLWSELMTAHWQLWCGSAFFCFIMEAMLFWDGILRVYAASVQLGIRNRAVGMICGMIPVINLLVLRSIIHTVSDEVEFETTKDRINRERAALQICRTRYPLLLVHGVFFRDSGLINYWGRIPAELERNGAVIYYGNHQSAASIPDSAAELSARIRQIVRETGCEKVNIIAHSKGGLDCRYAVSVGNAAPLVASVTTINTPHRGCGFADYLLEKIPSAAQEKIASAYNTALHKLGDEHPNFMAAVRDLTASRCKEICQEMDAASRGNIFCQSVGSRLNHASNGKFPLNFTYHLVKYFDGPNDGLVAEPSFHWGERYQFLTTDGKRGISHGDMVDLNRENIPGFDVREFYVQLVADLKQRGL